MQSMQVSIDEEVERNGILQGTMEWQALRRGKVTASRVADVMAKGSGATRDDYMNKIICERLTGKTTEGFKSRAMEQGSLREPEARARYEFVTGLKVETIAFVDHPTIPMSGCSPDGLIGADGMVQFKCPEREQHVRFLRGASIPGAYIKQIQFEMACCRRLWSDFVSYNPDFEIPLRLHIRRIKRDSAMIVEAETAVRAFLSDVERAVAELLADEAGEAAA